MDPGPLADKDNAVMQLMRPTVFVLLVSVWSSALTGQQPRSGLEAPATTSAPTSQAAYPLWDGKETVAEYARRAGINDVELTADLGRGISLKVKLIPAGTFMMGTTQRETEIVKRMGGRGAFTVNQEPRHEVTITRPFYMGIYTVTQEQYMQVCGDNPSVNKAPRNPVAGVLWTESDAFCKKLSEKAGRPVHLPTEAQWEYACRAGTTTAFHFADEISTSQANYDGDMVWGNGKKAVYRAKPMPVGSFKPNAWGLYDMHGNIAQWCADWYDKDYYARSPASDPMGPAASKDNSHVVRGGSWGYSPRDCRSASRDGMTEWRKITWTGFRVVVEMK